MGQCRNRGIEQLAFSVPLTPRRARLGRQLFRLRINLFVSIVERITHCHKRRGAEKKEGFQMLPAALLAQYRRIGCHRLTYLTSVQAFVFREVCEIVAIAVRGVEGLCRSAFSTVSMPLTWSQVKTDLDPKRFTIRTVPALLAKTSAWQDYCDGQRSLEQAIKRLAKSMKQAA